MRLKILGGDEIDALYAHPRFTHEERVDHFALSPAEVAALEQLHSIKSKIFFILQLGYFKARHMFFIFDLREVEDDVGYIRERYFPDTDQVDPTIAKGTRLKQQRLILELCNYRAWNTEEQKKLAARSRQAAKVSGKPIYIFRELTHYLLENRIVAPGYSLMQDTVGGALAYEQRRLASIVRSHLEQSETEALDRLLQDTQGLYEITLLKRDPRDFSNDEIKGEIRRGDRMCPLYYFAQRLLPRLKISNENVKYYASLVSYYSVHQLRQLSKWTAYVYLLCFVHYRYQKLHDNLIQSLLFHVRRHGDEAKAAAKEQVYNHCVASNADLQKAGRVLKFFTDGSVAESEPFGEVRIKAFAVLDPARLNSVADYMATKARFDETAFQWEHIDRAAPRFKRHLRPVLQSVEFAARSTDDPLIEAVHFLKAAFLSANEINFALLHLFGYQFAPRYKDLFDKVRTCLCGFKHPSQYGDAILMPVRKAQKELIINEWDNVQRIIVSLALKAKTQSTIVSKLSAYARNNRTKRALWEYDNIIQSLYLLNYIDSAPLRQNVQRAVNRGENYHQLRRAVSYANFGKLRFRTEYEQLLWSECSRLIANCIIYYNASILSHLLAHKENTGDKCGADLVKEVSPVAWQHINLYGRYEFRQQPAPVDVEEIVRELADVQIETDSTLAA